jgi:hypothetical protein
MKQNLLTKENILHQMRIVVNFHQGAKKINQALETVGIDTCFDDHYVIQELRNHYVNLIWKMILEIRGVEELTQEEYEFFDELFYDIAYDTRPSWNVEKMYDYFTDIEQIIKDFNIDEK